MKRFRRARLKREMRRRPINVLASVITTFSLYLGVLSILWCIRENHEKAALLIFGAIICDMLDGTVARITHSVSEFGKELDSLCDLVAFGVAPAVLIYHDFLFEEKLAGTVEGRTGGVMAIIFVICGALRLARYNVFQSGHRESFTGLPIPAAGGTIAAFVLFADYLDLRVAFWVLGPLTMGLSYLMISTFRFPKDRLKRAFVLAPQNAFRALALGVVVIAMIHYGITYSPVIVLFPVFAGYVLFGLGEAFVLRVRGRRSVTAPAAAATGGTIAAAPSEEASEDSNTGDRL
jgi:CDP-diacylglycerol--serine O-phosphatidyltransferase